MGAHKPYKLRELQTTMHTLKALGKGLSLSAQTMDVSGTCASDDHPTEFDPDHLKITSPVPLHLGGCV
jgi:hypothetical protein